METVGDVLLDGAQPCRTHAAPASLFGGVARRGGLGADLLDGGAGDDRFVFRPGAGADIVTDFEEGAGTPDTLDLSAFANLKTLADVRALATQAGADTLIDFRRRAFDQAR